MSFIQRAESARKLAFSKSTHAAADDDVTDATETLMTTSIAGAKAADAAATDGADDAAHAAVDVIDATTCSRIRTNTAHKRLQVRVHQCVLFCDICEFVDFRNIHVVTVVHCSCKLYNALFCV